MTDHFQHLLQHQEKQQQKRAAVCCYTGRWTPEEEAYVKHLIREFKEGTLDDIPEGRTLRAFLAEQIACKAKRVSKKFANSGYNGKLSFKKKKKTKQPPGGPVQDHALIGPTEEAAKRNNRRAELRRRFEESRSKIILTEQPSLSAASASSEAPAPLETAGGTGTNMSPGPAIATTSATQQMTYEQARASLAHALIGNLHSSPGISQHLVSHQGPQGQHATNLPTLLSSVLAPSETSNNLLTRNANLLNNITNNNISSLLLNNNQSNLLGMFPSTQLRLLSQQHNGIHSNMAALHPDSALQNLASTASAANNDHSKNGLALLAAFRAQQQQQQSQQQRKQQLATSAILDGCRRVPQGSTRDIATLLAWLNQKSSTG